MAGSITYNRDDASTSQLHKSYAQTNGSSDDNAILSGGEDADDPEDEPFLQFWTAPRHRSRKGKEKEDEEYGAFNGRPLHQCLAPRMNLP